MELKAALAELQDFMYDDGRIDVSLEQDAVSTRFVFPGEQGTVDVQLVWHDFVKVLGSAKEEGTR